MRILILGGSRFIGAWLTTRLASVGHHVTRFNRGLSQPPFPIVADQICGDIDQLDDHIEALQAVEADVVVHMLVSGAQRAWDFARLFARSPARAILISSIDVYRSYDRLRGRDSGPAIREPLHEDAPLRRKLYPYRAAPDTAPEDADGWARLWKQADYDKIPAELIFREAFKQRGTILRLPAVYGPGDVQHRLHSYVRRMDDGRPVILVDEQMADWRWSMSYVENVAEAIALAVEQPQAGGRTYNVGDASPPTTATWIQQIGARAGWRGRVVALPRERLPEGLRPDEDFSHPLVVDASRIRRELGFRPVRSVEDALDATIAWERANAPEQWPDPFDYDAEDAALDAV